LLQEGQYEKKSDMPSLLVSALHTPETSLVCTARLLLHPDKRPPCYPSEHARDDQDPGCLEAVVQVYSAWATLADCRPLAGMAMLLVERENAARFHRVDFSSLMLGLSAALRAWRDLLPCLALPASLPACLPACMHRSVCSSEATREAQRWQLLFPFPSIPHPFISTLDAL
jgi:hypothetical protein